MSRNLASFPTLSQAGVKLDAGQSGVRRKMPPSVHGNMMTVRYAVLMKVHYWDDFAKRRLRHLLNKVGTGDVYVFVDETHGAVGQISYDKVLRATEADLRKLELVLYPPGKAFWYNVDYPLYYFYLEHGSYDYYLMCEHDAVLNIDIDEFVAAADKDRVDYVGYPLDHSSWTLQTGDGVYPKSFRLSNWLSCISLHSKTSVGFLLGRATDSFTSLHRWRNRVLAKQRSLHTYRNA